MSTDKTLAGEKSPTPGNVTSLITSPALRGIHYVRVRDTSRQGFVEFDFAIDDPSLFVELVLPVEAFRDFCELNSVVHMNDEQAHAVDLDVAKWRYGNMDRNRLSDTEGQVAAVPAKSVPAKSSDGES